MKKLAAISLLLCLAPGLFGSSEEEQQTDYMLIAKNHLKNLAPNLVGSLATRYAPDLPVPAAFAGTALTCKMLKGGKLDFMKELAPGFEGACVGIATSQAIGFAYGKLDDIYGSGLVKLPGCVQSITPEKLWKTLAIMTATGAGINLARYYRNGQLSRKLGKYTKNEDDLQKKTMAFVRASLDFLPSSDLVVDTGIGMLTANLQNLAWNHSVGKIFNSQ